MKNSTSGKLQAFYKTFQEGDHILIVINADPDSIASAMAVKRLLWRKVSSVTISNINILDRPDNTAMVSLLDVKMTHIDDIDGTLYNRFVIVDSQPDHHECFAKYTYDAVIDHHPITFSGARFSDIRPEYGATSSIMTQYLRAAGIKPSVKLATGLFHAIKVDTGGFQRKTVIEDMRAFQFLFRHANMHMASKIEQSEIKFDNLKYYKKALTRKILRKDKLFVHLGAVESPDICVNIADFFLKVESVQWSIVSGIYNKTLIIIFRNDGIRKNAGKLASKSFGEIGSAGGHKSAARAEIPVPDLKNIVRSYRSMTLIKWIMKKV
jgi:nanoRNase/pAp phosphatase (c-di-AMP/oligoRNAs hydrolase)